MEHPPAAFPTHDAAAAAAAASAGQGRRRRTRQRQRAWKNKEESESQRMTHIAVERNRRRQMNEHLTVLRSLMPESYIQRGDQASIVGGAIDFVKELEQLLQSLEARKRALLQRRRPRRPTAADHGAPDDMPPPFADFFSFPQYTRCQNSAATLDHHFPAPPRPPEATQAAALADIEVSLIETHASIRILSPKRPGQLLKMVAALQGLKFTVLHLNVTALDSMVLYSLSLKVEEGCNLSSVDDIAAAVHSMLSMIEAEVFARVT